METEDHLLTFMSFQTNGDILNEVWEISLSIDSLRNYFDISKNV